ncbi:MAG: DMT family transporter [Alphaproteobacteria bacterium]|nr:DMT family transporter [Alphaproteobacteria bacterium]
MVVAAPEEATDRRRELIGIACVLISALALSLKGILAKFIFAEGVDVATLLAIRYTLTLPMLVVVALWLKGGATALRMPWRDFGLGAVGGLIGYYVAGLLDFTALEMIDVSVERVLLFSFPVFVLLLDGLRRRRPPPRRQILALILAEAGIIMVMGVTDPAIFFANLEGGLFAIASAFAFAIYFMMNQSLGPRLGSARMALAAVAGATLGIDLHFVAFASFDSLAMSGTAWLLIVAIAIFCSVVPFLLVTEGIRRVGAARSALISTVGPVATLGLAALVLDEVLTFEQLAGAGLVIGSVMALEGRLPRWRRKA